MRFFFISVFLLISIQPAFSSIQLRSIYYNMDDPIITEYISNSSDINPIFVKAEVYKLEFDSIKKEFVEVTLKDERELMLTPSKFVIQPKRTIPFKIIGKRSEELELYRVRFKSISSDDVDDYFDESELEDLIITPKVSAELLLSYGVVVYKNPINKVFDTKVNKKPNIVEVFNNGNSTILLTDIKICQNKDETSCEMMPEYFVSPKQSTTMPGYRVNFNVVEDGKLTRFN
ncbi:hypothetical protein [Vibrio crassostreae]|uniref:hypothetical protein n=1 Tax=Vibrio crassostreae TaxID=246167 RepID=UPI001B3055F1|nr:hypothetical protein [Vibrio crassostreae]CAK3513611.1 conserved hypothetical protein [Vibrio crassostreae]CAK3515437.1 conserved hypothetical protein [Vibrio crassostreae]CAK3912476.1 conserved hypothetical protein [Vibrio crassostreae]